MTSTPTRAEAEARLTDEVLEQAWLAEWEHGADVGVDDFRLMRERLLTALYGPTPETPTPAETD